MGNYKDQNIATTLQGVHRIAIGFSDEITYIYHKYKDRKNMDAINQNLSRSLNYIRYYMLNNYLRAVNTYPVDDDFFNTDGSGLNLNRLKDNIRDIARSSEDDIVFKVESSEVVMYIRIANCGQNTMIAAPSDCIVMFVSQFFVKSGVCMVFQCMLDEGNTLHCNDMVVGPFFFAKKQKMCEAFINTKGLIGKRILDSSVAYVLEQSTSLYLDHHAGGLVDLPSPHHVFMEKQIYSIIMKKHPDLEVMRSTNIHDWRNEDVPSDVKFDPRRFDTFPDDIKGLITGDSNTNVPYIDFSAREWKFVDRYAKEKKLIYDPDEELDVPVLNLAEVLQNQRYGNIIKFKYQLNGSDRFDIIVGYEYTKSDDTCRFYIIYQGLDNITPYAVVDYYNLRECTIAESLVRATSNIYVKDLDSLPSSGEEITGIIPESFNKDAGIVDMLWNALAIFLVIHDRPDRHKMVREERKISNNQSNRPRSKSKSSRGQKNDSDTIVISRVLMPAKEAKEYVQRMSSDSSGNCERNYVLESWERVGHWRRLPNSEKKIWINETTCNRHKKLTDKEIHIKL